jgi:transposase
MNNPVSEKYFAGIDVGAQELVLVLRNNAKSQPAQTFANTRVGHKNLVKVLSKVPLGAICLEATGAYSVDISNTLYDANLPIMVLNPMSSHNFAKVLGKHSKTDNVDGDTLAQFAQLMPFQPWVRPSKAAMALRVFSRHIHAMTKQKAASKNMLHALMAAADTPKSVLADATLAITQLERRIKKLNAAALAFIKKDKNLSAAYDLLLTVKGIGDASAIALLGELMMLPKGLTRAQWVKYAGLDPQHFKSGTSVEKKARISKGGIHYLRGGMYMPALSAKTHDPYVRAYFDHLIDLGKTRMQAVCAVMRKMLHALHGMLTNNQPFDNTRFYRIPENKLPLAS